MHNTAQNLFAFHTFKIKSWRSSPVNSPGSDCETCCFVAKDSNVRFDALTQVEETRAILHGRPVRGNLQRFDRYQIERLESLGNREAANRVFIPVWLQTKLNDTKSCYKQIKTMAKFDSTIQTSLQPRANTRKVGLRNSLRWSIYLINQIMLLWLYLTPTQHHSKTYHQRVRVGNHSPLGYPLPQPISN